MLESNESFMTMKLYYTTDYTKFRTRKDNREVDLSHVMEIKRSLEKCNDLVLNPIKVTPAMEVVDGQHRLKAAQELRIPVYYVIDENFYPEKIRLYNTAVKEWNKSAFLNCYVESGNESYQKLKEFMDEYSLPLGLGLVWTGQGSVPRRDFDDGTYTFRFPQEMRKALTNTQRFINVLLQKAILAKKYLDSQTFHRACRQFFSSELVDVDIFIQSIEKNYGNGKIVKRNTTKDYIENLIDAYNYKKSKGRLASIIKGVTCKIINEP